MENFRTSSEQGEGEKRKNRNTKVSSILPPHNRVTAASVTRAATPTRTTSNDSQRSLASREELIGNKVAAATVRERKINLLVSHRHRKYTVGDKLNKNEDVFANSQQLLQVAEIALKDDPDLEFLTPLKGILSEKKTKSHELIKLFQNSGSIEATLNQTYGNFGF